jgi:hypothetical protein
MGKATSYQQTNAEDFYQWSFTPLTESIRQFFEASYSGIFRANTVLNNIENIEFDDEALKNQYIGEARFIRAFYYFYLVRIFGEVPVYTTETNPNASYDTPVTSIEDIYKLIISDLRYAAENVPAFRVPGRADKTAAEAQLAKVYLHLASSKEYDSPRYEWVSNHSQMYDSAAYFADNVLNSSVFDLDPSIFNTFPDNEANSLEKLYIWSVNLDPNSNVGSNYLHTRYMPYTYYSKFYTDEPGTGNIIGYWGGWSILWYKDEYYNTHLPGDLRLELYMDTQYGDINGVNPAASKSFCLKYASETKAFYTGTSSVFFLRMSDIALVYAEAMGPTAEAYNQVNRIRQRAGIANLTPGLSRTDFIEAVWQERLWELNMEGHTFFDLRRTHQMNEFVGREVSYAYFHPIPQREIDLNSAIDADPEKETLN